MRDEEYTHPAGAVTDNTTFVLWLRYSVFPPELMLESSAQVVKLTDSTVFPSVWVRDWCHS